MDAPFVTYEAADRVAILTLNRPQTRNAFSTPADCHEVVAAVQRANSDPEIAALIITGAGAAFSSGGDLKKIRDRTGVGPRATPAETRDNYDAGVQTMIRAIDACDIATIAAINGAAIGLGLGVALACDMRVLSEDAQVSQSFVKIGIVPGDGGAIHALRAVGYAQAAELLLTGDAISAPRALAIGLVNKLAPAADVLNEAKALAARVAVNPRRALRLTKRLLREARHARLSDILELSAAFQALAHETADHKEAADAFIEKRPPTFTGG